MAGKNKIDFGLLGRVMQLTKPHRTVFFWTGFLAIILAPLGTARPYLINIMVDKYIVVGNIQGLIRMSIILVVLLVITALARYAFNYLSNWLGQLVIRDLRVSVFNHIIHLGLPYFDKTAVGQSTTRTINDIETINSIFTQGTVTIVADLLGMVAVLVIMFITSVKLTLICLIALPFLIWAGYIFKEKAKSSFQIVRTKIAQMNAFLNERITGMRIVQIFNAETQEARKFRLINRDYTQANLDTNFYYAVFFPVVELIAAFTLALMVWWGARGALTGQVTIGELIAFPIYLTMLLRPVRMLADRFNTLQMGLVAAERVFNILDKEHGLKDNGSLVVEQVKGLIEFDHVTFSYDGQVDVLKDISFEVQPGQTLAVVGHTGSGKSTLINLLNRFYPLKNGEIRVDAIPLETYDMRSLRQRMALVLQDVFLFTGSVFDNITLRNEHITREEVIESSQLIGAHDFIEKLPGGYDFVVMERGNNLSMGQRQLISFVRALVFNPNILILDEATSSIDTETEAVIQYAIETLISKRTSIIIAHRLSTIRHADQIMVMDKGQIKEMGTHDELLRIENGFYKKLYDMQFADLQPVL
ncbi:MAG: ABC transporter ATP-binding protein [Saprospiraceae bacterium]|nr:ABC transporter ATP-binding protein [Saprospiraceae bacterium]MCB9320588.1 ABC transporter ATP-binding protein [Lewinellaceae bacterium]